MLPSHWECYAARPHRREFAGAYFRTLIYRFRVNPYWSLVHISEHPLFPDLEREDIRAALAFAADRERRLMVDPAT